MFVSVFTYRAKIGEEDAIIALHEDWERNQCSKSCFSWQLLTNILAPRDFIDIVQFENEDLAQVATTNFKKDAWFDRLISLTEGEAVHINYINVWQLQ